MNTAEIPETASALISGAVEAQDSLSLSVRERWLQGRSWFGGIQMALALKAARRMLGNSLPFRSIHATFLAPVLQSEPAIAKAAVLRAGRSVTHVRAQLSQGDRTCFECTAIAGASRDTEIEVESNSACDAAPERAFKLPFRPGVTPNFTQNYDLCWARGKPPFTGATDATARIFARPRAAQARYDETEFLAITDAIPPPVISIMRTLAPVSSMNCALELVRPEIIYGTRQWLRFEVVLHDAHSGYSWQTAHIYGETGALLAIAHQSVAIFG